MEKTANENKVSFFSVVLLIVALIILSVLSSLPINHTPFLTTLIVMLYILVFSLGIFFSAILLIIPNTTVKSMYGFSSIIKATTNGFAFLFPFAVLAFFSDIVFHWNAIQAISSAAVFTCISVASSDLMKLGGKKAGNMILTFLASALFISLYIGLSLAVKIIFSKA